MGLKTAHLKRYRDLAMLLIKYGREDIVRESGLYEPSYSEDELSFSRAKAESLPDDLERLGPTYIKLGQFLSTRSDFLPPPYLESLARLQDKTESFPFEEVGKIISSELGIRISKAFERFEKTPVASASLAQVHLAELRGGKKVAVKVQRPGIRDQIFKDLDAFDEISAFLEKNTSTGRQLMLNSTLNEFRKSLIRELDYRQEARNLILLKRNLEKFTRLVVPSVIEDYSSSRVLTMDYVEGRNIVRLSPLTRLEMDGAELAEELFRAYLQQILIDGFYHADPHPGNIFLTDDNRIALLDLGMVAYIPQDLQIKLMRLLIAISEGNGEQAANYALGISRKEEQADDLNFRREVYELITQFQDPKLESIQAGRLVFEMMKISGANHIRLPEELIMLGKTLLNLDEVGRTLDPLFDPNASLRKNTADIMRNYMKKSLSPGSFFEYMLDMKEFFEYLPARINKIMDSLAKGNLTIKARVLDEKFVMDELKEMASRLTIGLILASLIIGAALLMQVKTPFTILGYPGIAIIFFLIAGIGGVIISFRIIFEKWKRKK